MGCNRQHKKLQQANRFATTATMVCCDGQSCIRFASKPRRRHGMVATIHGEAATSGGHPMAVVTTTRRGDHDRTVVLQLRRAHAGTSLYFCCNQPQFLLLPSSDFAGTRPIFCYHRLYFAGTGVSFCFHRVVFLLEPASHLLCFHHVAFFCWNMSHFFASTMFCFAEIDTGFCYNRYWLRATPSRHLMLQLAMRTASEGEDGRRERPARVTTREHLRPARRKGATRCRESFRTCVF